MFVIPSPVNTYANLLGRGLLGRVPCEARRPRAQFRKYEVGQGRLEKRGSWTIYRGK
jgi:hypothetical protein